MEFTQRNESGDLNSSQLDPLEYSLQSNQAICLELFLAMNFRPNLPKLKKKSIRSIFDLVKQASSLFKVYIPSCLFIIAIWLLTKGTDISVYELVADPNEVGSLAPYTGMVSIIGGWCFCCASGICFFCSELTKNNSKSDNRWKLFLQASGCLMLLLLIDDTFQLHENLSTLLYGAEANISISNRKLQNILETIVFGFYGLLFVLYGFYFRKLIYRTNIFTLILAFGFFVISIVIDILFESMLGHFILEEGFKLLGIVSLVTYYIQICYYRLKQSS